MVTPSSTPLLLVSVPEFRVPFPIVPPSVIVVPASVVVPPRLSMVPLMVLVPAALRFTLSALPAVPAMLAPD